MVAVGGIDWDGNGHSWSRSGKIDGREVAVIRKLKNHTHSNTGNWQVEIDGIVMQQTFRAVRDAQEFAAERLEQVFSQSALATASTFPQEKQ